MTQALPPSPAQVSEEEARSMMGAEPYKIEILDGILEKDPNAEITIYHIGGPASCPCPLAPGPDCAGV